jgi:glycosyltransferase involved in cell wall biosynthesis
MNPPLVSVILPTYNRSHLIRRAIKSVINQTYTDIEIIIVDDASDDNTEAVIETIDDKRVVYIRHNMNKGGAASRNTGIIKAQGKYIAFQDDDDEWINEKLEKQMNVMLNSSSRVGVVYSSFKRIKNHNFSIIPENHILNKEGRILHQLLDDNFVSTQVSLVRKECFFTAGLFDEKLPRLQDWDLWIRISKHYEFRFIEEPLANVYHTKDSITTDDNAWIKAQKIILEKYYDDFLQAGNDVAAKQLFRLGRYLHRVGLRKESQMYILKALNLNKVYKYFIGYILTYLPYFSLKRNSPF